MSTMIARNTRPSTKQKVGLALAGFYSLLNIGSVLFPTPEGEEGPPFYILALGSALGIVGLVAVVAAWRGNAVANRVAAGAIIVVTLTGLPAFFVEGIPAGIRILVGVSVLYTIAAVYLMFSSERRPAFE